MGSLRPQHKRTSLRERVADVGASTVTEGVGVFLKKVPSSRKQPKKEKRNNDRGKKTVVTYRVPTSANKKNTE